MHRPVLLLIPVAMLLDYVLTIVGARLRETAFARHVQIEHYELNPLWQNAVARKRWFEPRHLALVALMTVVMFQIDYPKMPGDWELADFFLGMVLTTFGIVNGRHVATIAINLYLRRHPDEASGLMHMSHALVLGNSCANVFAIIVPLAVLALLQPTATTCGAVAGATALLVVNLLWLWIAQRKAARLARETSQRERDAGTD